MAEKDENDGYKFAITFLAASGSIFYATYNYLQNTPIRAESFCVLCFALTCVLISIICFLIYILIKGYLMDTKNGDSTKNLNRSAQVAYKFALGFFTFSLIIFISILSYIVAHRFFTGLLQELGVAHIVLCCVSLFLSIITVSLVYALVVYYRGEHRSWSYFSHLFFIPVIKNAQVHGIILVGIVIIVLLFGVLNYTPFHGHVTIDMESVYYKNNTPIPVSIQVTGPNADIGVLLYTKNSSNSSALMSILWGMEPDFFGQGSEDVLKRKLHSDNVSVGSYLGNGKYCVFINTTNLPIGYYELICIREGFWKETCEGKSFYLVNKNQQ